MGSEEVVRAYRALLGDLDRLLPGSVGGLGPPARGPAPAPSVVVRAAGGLALRLEEVADPARREFLRAQLVAVEWTARRLAGQRVAIADELARSYGVRAAPGDPDAYLRAHAALDALLPGRGDLATRWRVHRRADRVPREVLPAALTAVAAALRDRTRAVVALPAGEDVAFSLVDTAPWAALQTDLGDHRSRVTVNAGAARWGRLVPLVAHEAYPGHHVERCRVAVAGGPEQQPVVVVSPQAVLAEGAAETGLAVVAGSGWREVARGLPFDVERAELLHAAAAPLARVRLDAVLLLATAGATAAVEHLRRWALLDEERARRVVDGLRHPLWRTYPAASVGGPELVRRWWAADPTPARFVRLLDEPLTPAALLAGATASGAWTATDGGCRAMSGGLFR